MNTALIINIVIAVVFVAVGFFVSIARNKYQELQQLRTQGLRAAPKAATDDDGESTKAGTHWDRFVSLLPYVGVTALVLLGLVLAVSIVGGVLIPHSIVRDLSDADLARGVITFIFAVGTIGIALLLAIGALVGKTADQFTRGKEVLTVLIGVFGTILGFYFGTAKAPSAPSPPASPASAPKTKTSKSVSPRPAAGSSTSTPAAAQPATATPSSETP